MSNRFRFAARVVIRAARGRIMQDAIGLVQRLHILLGAAPIRVTHSRLLLVQALDLMQRGIVARAKNLVIVAFGAQVYSGILEFESAIFNQLSSA